MNKRAFTCKLYDFIISNKVPYSIRGLQGFTYYAWFRLF
jgi:hypothetical protein